MVVDFTGNTVTGYQKTSTGCVRAVSGGRY